MYIDKSNGDLDLIYRVVDTEELRYLYLDTLIIRGRLNRYKGIGTKALNLVIADAFKYSCKFIELKADTKQPQLEGFVLVDWYKRFGFVEVSKAGYFVVMRKYL